ncbi:MAG: MBL fold metallo-hydrolase [Bacillota bacterium]
MKISYLGHSSFKLTESTGTSIITDPYDVRKVGIKFPKVAANAVTISHKHSDHDAYDAVGGDPKVIDTTGVFNIDGVKIYGFMSYHDAQKGALRGKNIIYKFRMDGVDICHLGDIGEPLTPMLAELIGSVNVLLIPVGGIYTIDSNEAKSFIDRLMPDVVIPMHYKTEGSLIDVDAVDEFIDVADDMEIVYSSEKEIEYDRTDFDNESTTIVVMNKID